MPHVDEVDDTFPSHTADTVTIAETNTRSARLVQLSPKVNVWVQTLNSFHRDEAQRETHFYVAMEMFKFSKGSDLEKVYLAEFTAFTLEEQVDYLVQHQINSGKVYAEAILKYPYPIRPERTTQSDDAFVTDMQKYDTACKKCEADREKYTTKRTDELRANATKLTEDERIKRCMVAFRENMHSNLFNKRMTVEVLYRAVRREDAHGKRYYTSIDDVIDLDDDIRDILITKYRECDNVEPATVPI